MQCAVVGEAKRLLHVLHEGRLVALGLGRLAHLLHLLHRLHGLLFGCEWLWHRPFSRHLANDWLLVNHRDVLVVALYLPYMEGEGRGGRSASARKGVVEDGAGCSSLAADLELELLADGLRKEQRLLVVGDERDREVDRRAARVVKVLVVI